MSVPGKWFGFDSEEILDEAIALFNRREFADALETFETLKTAALHEELPVTVEGYIGECRQRLSQANMGRAYLS